MIFANYLKKYKGKQEKEWGQVARLAAKTGEHLDLSTAEHSRVRGGQSPTRGSHGSGWEQVRWLQSAPLSTFS